MADAVKLFSKQAPRLHRKSPTLYTLGPGLCLGLALAISLLPSYSPSPSIPWNAFAFLALLSLGVYPLFFMGTASYSKYPIVGALRGISQTISYEISLAIFIIRLILPAGGALLQGNLSLSLISFPTLTLLFVTLVAETNRTPFDFSEGERELVSGFNTEYGGGAFALIFMGEYAIIIVLSVVFVFLRGVSAIHSPLIMAL